MDMPVLMGRSGDSAADLWANEGEKLVEVWGDMPSDIRYNILRTHATLSEEDAKALQNEPLAEIRHKLAESPNALYIVLASVGSYGDRNEVPQPEESAEAFTVSRMPRVHSGHERKGPKSASMKAIRG